MSESRYKLFSCAPADAYLPNFTTEYSELG
jgi:hypothetical protein